MHGFCELDSTAGCQSKIAAFFESHFYSKGVYYLCPPPREITLLHSRQNVHHTCQFSKFHSKWRWGPEQDKGISTSEGCHCFNNKASLSFPHVDRWGDYFFVCPPPSAFSFRHPLDISIIPFTAGPPLSHLTSWHKPPHCICSLTSK